MEKYLKWEEIDIAWENIDMVWEEIILEEVAEVIRKHGGGQAYIDGNPWDITKKELGEEKTKKFIKIFCRVNELEYEKVLESKVIKVTISQLEKVFNEGKKVGVKINFNK